jgi:hypothetical protein
MDYLSEQYLKNLNDLDFIQTLKRSYSSRKISSTHNQRFYFRRGLIELGIKATISASLILALLVGAPAALVTFVGAVLLKISTFIFNQYQPVNQVPESNQPLPTPIINEEGIPSFRKQWLVDIANDEFNFNVNQLRTLEIRIAFSLITGFINYSILNTYLSLPIVIASVLFAFVLTEQAVKVRSSYLEDEQKLNQFFIQS